MISVIFAHIGVAINPSNVMVANKVIIRVISDKDFDSVNVSSTAGGRRFNTKDLPLL